MRFNIYEKNVIFATNCYLYTYLSDGCPPFPNFKRNSYIFIKENAFENVVSEMAAILSRPQCVTVK